MNKNNQTVWMLQTKKADFSDIGQRFHINPVIARIIRNRNVIGDENIQRYLHGSLEDLFDPHLMKDMDRTVLLLKEKIKQGKPIRIVGDYDIDGVCSTYILYQGLTRCGATVDYQIPERIRDGYGINESIIRKAYDEGIDTIITCDNGIAAGEQIRMAKDLGLTVFVTDHHEVPVDEHGEELPPPADTIINPKQKACAYPFPEICGAVVAFKLIQVLYEIMGIPLEEWRSLLEFASIATVGDVMRLQGENRIIVRSGLQQMQNTRSLGLRKLTEACGLDISALSAYHIGFVIGPCLNASGRLQTAKLALELLLCQDETAASSMAENLRVLNEERKNMTQKGVEEALKQVEEQYKDDSVLVIFLPDCHESVAGIIAGRVRETWNKPVFVLTRGEGCVKGSGRSIEAYHMFRKMCEVQELFLKFGGHPMAAGFSMEERHVDEFRRRLNQQANLKPEDFISKVWIDVAMPLEYITENLVQELKILEPFGQGNEKPQFAQKNLRICSARVLGKNRNAVKLILSTEKGFLMDSLLFTDGDHFLEELGNQKIMDVVYYPDINEYNGRRTLQIIIREYKLHP